MVLFLSPTIHIVSISIAVFLLVIDKNEAHQSISFPYPISRHVACRIGDGANCPGPCPRSHLRMDMNPNNPSLTVPRGNWVKIRILANNHLGGFNRWSLVHVKDMNKGWKHRKNAFLFSCADTWIQNCTRRNRRRDCPYDKRNVHFLHKLQIPKIYPDGVYVLGWVWYGGADGKGEFGSFGDYYDCMYVKIQGGPLEDSHQPIFKAGRTVSGRDGMCRATVNKVGECWKEPCPGGGRSAKLKRPYEFTDRKPGPLSKTEFLEPYSSQGRNENSPFITSIDIRSADHPEKVFSSSHITTFPYLNLTTSMRVTVTCKVRGEVKTVTFYDNGREGIPNYGSPFSIAGEWKKNGVWMFAPWKLDIDKMVTTISCKAVGSDGTEHWKTIELSTDM